MAYLNVFISAFVIFCLKISSKTSNFKCAVMIILVQFKYIYSPN